jgi:hypothetical protein
VRSPHVSRAASAVFVLLAACATLPAASAASSPAAATARPITVYVAPAGSDTAAGTGSAPYATIQHAVDVLAAHPGGGTVVLDGGRYHQRVALHQVSDITVTAAPGQDAILDGSGLRVPDGRSAMVDVSGSTGVTVAGLEITGYRTSAIAGMPIGVYVHGGDTRITLTGLHVHDMGNDNETLGSMDMNAHGIAAYGDSPTRAISGLTIADNEVDHLRLGASESVVVNGNVEGWSITGNRIHDDDNIGIDAIGYEPTLPAPYRYTGLNRARDGVISGNTVVNIKSEGNPAYWSDGSWCNCADGIYVDGGTRITIAGNNTVRDDIGIEVAAENPKGAADHVTVTGNRISESRYVGIATGGYCDGGEDCGGVGTGRSYDNTFTGNTLRDNNTDDDGSPQFLIQYYEQDNRISGNTICATGDQNLLIGTVPRSGSGSGDIVEGNTYASASAAASAQWGWRAVTYTGFAAYRAATGLDAHSTYHAGAC